MDERRYQVFVSSTSQDLADERQIVINALLEASYIPVGMELFNAATENAWPVIERLINNCDYYIVIVAGRYGSERPDGRSFTQSEYEYATEVGKPRLAFLRRHPDSLPRRLTEPTEIGMSKVREFRRTLENDLLCKYWDRSGDELAGKIISSLNNAVVSDPQPGWVRVGSLDALASEIRSDLVEPARSLGIGRISPDGQAGPVMSKHIADAQSIAIMSTSATRLVEIQKSYLVNALSRGCAMRVLVPELDSVFLHDVEQSESEDAYREPISDEILKVQRRLQEAIGEVTRMAARDVRGTVGNVRVGYFTTHLRCTMVLCDDSWGWLTITLPPARAPETPSFELHGQGRYPLLAACIRHFNRTWDIVTQRNNIQNISAGGTAS
jgi:hypothetical protein